MTHINLIYLVDSEMTLAMQTKVLAFILYMYVDLPAHQFWSSVATASYVGVSV